MQVDEAPRGIFDEIVPQDRVKPRWAEVRRDARMKEGGRWRTVGKENMIHTWNNVIFRFTGLSTMEVVEYKTVI